MNKREPTQPSKEELLTRRQVAERWKCCTETLKRREKSGLLPFVVLSTRLKRYRLSDIEALATNSLSGGRA